LANASKREQRLLASYAEQEHFRASVSLVKVESYREIREIREVKDIKDSLNSLNSLKSLDVGR
jgi:hypothetical protein